jgi:hypothetical protein
MGLLNSRTSTPSARARLALPKSVPRTRVPERRAGQPIEVYGRRGEPIRVIDEFDAVVLVVVVVSCSVRYSFFFRRIMYLSID